MVSGVEGPGSWGSHQGRVGRTYRGRMGLDGSHRRDGPGWDTGTTPVLHGKESRGALGVRKETDPPATPETRCRTWRKDGPSHGPCSSRSHFTPDSLKHFYWDPRGPGFNTLSTDDICPRKPRQGGTSAGGGCRGEGRRRGPEAPEGKRAVGERTETPDRGPGVGATTPA